MNESDDLTIFDPQATWKKSTLAGGTYTMRELLVPIFIKGQCVYKSPLLWTSVPIVRMN